MLTAITMVVVMLMTIVSISSALGNVRLRDRAKEAIGNDIIGCMANGLTRNDIIGCVEVPRGFMDSNKLH